MAKRTSSGRSSAQDSASAGSDQTPPSGRRRSRGAATRSASVPDTTATTAGVQGSEAGDDAPLESMTAKATSSSTTSTSMGSEPSEEDIRRRAYQRYLERGGRPGLAFEDWLEAERELKTSKPVSNV